jgi:hypothetical protein
MTTTPVAQMPLTLGQQLHLAGDPNPWTVKAVSEHFAALTRPTTQADVDGDAEDDDVDAREMSVEVGEPLYTIVDWRNGVRGPCNVYGWRWGDRSDADYAAMLAEFESGELEVSHRNQVRIEFGEVAW